MKQHSVHQRDVLRAFGEVGLMHTELRSLNGTEFGGVRSNPEHVSALQDEWFSASSRFREDGGADCSTSESSEEVHPNVGAGPLGISVGFLREPIASLQQLPDDASDLRKTARPARKKTRHGSQALVLVSNTEATRAESVDERREDGNAEEGEKKPQRSSTMKENFIAGASASFLSKLILQPFDTTKTILQSHTNNYKNLVDCAAGVVKTQGVMGLYRGFGAGIGTSAPSSAIFFATYEAVKKWTEIRFPNSLGKVGPVVAAAAGNVVASVVRVPPEVVKQRVQARLYPNIITAITEMSRTEGIGGFYTGYGIQLARDIPYAAIQFMTFETLKKAYGVNRPQEAGAPPRPVASEAKKVLTNLWMGAVAGLVASVVTTPMDVVKTRVMTQDLTQGAVKIGVRQTVRSILKHEGPLAFTYGMLPRVMLKVPASALFLVAYEGMKRLLIALEVTQRAAQLVKVRAAREARDLARRNERTAWLKQHEGEQQLRRERQNDRDADGRPSANEYDELSSPRAMSEAVLASIALSGPTSRKRSVNPVRRKQRDAQKGSKG